MRRGRRAAFRRAKPRKTGPSSRALSEVLGHKLLYDNRAQLVAAIERRRRILRISVPRRCMPIPRPRPGAASANGPLDATVPLKPAIADFYLTNPVARASETHGQVRREFSGATKMAAE